MLTGNEARHVVGEFLRFGVVGVALTAFVSATYVVLVYSAAVEPGAAVVIATIAATIVGFFAHREISFRGRSARRSTAHKMLNFFGVNAAGLLLNMAWVALTTKTLALPAWAPVVLFCTLTPIATFYMNRRWVF